MKKLKVCVIHRYPAKEVLGTNPSFITLLENLAKKHDTYLITFKDKFNIKGVKFIPINLSFKRESNFDKLFKSLLFLILAPLNAFYYNLRYKFDVIYCDDNLPLYWYFIKKLTRAKTILRMGDMWGLFYQEKHFSLPIRLIFKLMFYFERKLMWNSMNKICVLSEALRNYLINVGVNKNRLEVITECINLDEFKNLKEDKDLRKKINADKIIISHGYFHKYKKADVLLYALNLVARKHKNVKLILIGDGPDLGNLREKVKELNLNNKVMFTGWLKFEEVLKYIKINDIGITTRSRSIANNFLVVSGLLQDMASEKGVIAPNLSAISSLVNGKNGLLYEVENYKDLANKINYLLDNPKKLKAMGNLAKKAVKKYDKDIIAMQLLNAIENV